MTKFRDTHNYIIIIDETVEVRWHSSNRNHYESAGYKFTNYGDLFFVHSSDLTRRNSMRVLVECPVCKSRRYARMHDIGKMGHSCCYDCARTENLIGTRFGRLVVLGLDFENTTDRVRWICECDCGAICSVLGQELKNKGTRSCGCLFYDVSSMGVKYHQYKLYGYKVPDEVQSKRRNHKVSRLWKKSVIDRDGCCDICGEKNRSKLEAHHLNSYKHFPSQRAVVENGITLCSDCHISFHSWLGCTRVKCTTNDYHQYKLYLSSAD